MLNYIKSFWNPSNNDQKNEYSEIPRFTYRSEFTPIPNTSITCDSGWGCCYRCCQGIAARYIKIIHEKDPKIFEKAFNGVESYLSLFEDTLDAPFSIQNLVMETEKLGVSPGEWAKPSQVAVSLSNIFNKYTLHNYVSLNCLIEPSKLQQAQYPMILMISLMCGLQEFDQAYFPFMKYLFTLPETIGIVSGFSGSAYYVVNINDSEVVSYFDPHVIQLAAKSSESNETFFNQKLMTMALSQLNPSILICFICLDKQSTDTLVKNICEFPNSPISLSEIISDDVIDQVLDIDDLDLS